MNTDETKPLLATGINTGGEEALPTAPPLADEPPPYEEPVMPGGHLLEMLRSVLFYVYIPNLQ